MLIERRREAVHLNYECMHQMQMDRCAKPDPIRRCMCANTLGISDVRPCLPPCLPLTTENYLASQPDRVGVRRPSHAECWDVDVIPITCHMEHHGTITTRFRMETKCRTH